MDRRRDADARNAVTSAADRSVRSRSGGSLKLKPRYASEEDIPEIVRVINLAYRVEDFFIDGDRTNRDEIAARMALPDVRFLVVDASEPDRLAAAVSVDIHAHRGHFAMLSVDPAYQGAGLGRALIAAVEDHCLRAGCNALDMEIVNLREELPAFYSALGFTTRGIAPFSNRAKLTREAHLILMTKSLAAEFRHL